MFASWFCRAPAEDSLDKLLHFRGFNCLRRMGVIEVVFKFFWVECAIPSRLPDTQQSPLLALDCGVTSIAAATRVRVRRGTWCLEGDGSYRPVGPDRWQLWDPV